MKKIIVLLFAMFICFSPAFAEAQTNSHGKPPKGYNYSKNKRMNNRLNKKQMAKFRMTKGHVCSGHRYKRGH